MLLDAGLVEEHATGLDSGCAAALREGTSRGDARVSSLELDDDMLGVKHLLQAAEDLLVHALLDLRTSREVIHDTVELGETNDFAIGEVADMRYSTEKEEVMLAHRGEGNVLLEHHRVGANRECGAGGEVLRLEASAKLFHVHLGDAMRSLLNRGISEVHSQGLQNCLELLLDLGDLLSLGHGKNLLLV